MGRRYNSSSDDDGDRNYRRRRRLPSSGSSDSDRHSRGRERKASGRVEREKRDDLSPDRVEVGRERIRPDREERETGRSDSDKEKMKRKVSGRVEREKRYDLSSGSDGNGRGREGKRTGVVEREKGVEGLSDSEIETLKRDRNGRGVRERKGSGIVEREKGVDSSSDSDKKKSRRDRDRRGGERKESGVGEREKGVEGLSDSDKEKSKRDRNERGRGRKESGIGEREKGVEGSSDSEKEKMKRDGNGRGRERKGTSIVEREKGVEGSSDSEREKPRRGDGNRRDRVEKRSRTRVTETDEDGNNRDRKKDRYRKERHEKDNSDEEGEILAAETRKRRDRERRESRHERDREDRKHATNDSMLKKQFLSQLGDVNADMASGRSGGVYIPPFKLARMMKEVEDKCSVEYQRLTWDALRKSINGLVNKVNATNIKNIVPELFSENLVRGRGLFCRSCMKSQMASPAFTDVFAALAAVVNTKFPQIGYLLLKRIILQLKRAYKRNDKPQLLAAVKFIAHLVNQQVVHELVALELLTLLLDKPTDDSVEVAVGFVTECGSILQDLCPRGLHGIFESFRGILHEGEIDKRVQFLIEGLFAIRKAKFQGHPAVRPELDLVEQEDQLTHEISLAEDEDLDPETILDIFRPDPDFLKNEKIYEDHKKNILGDDSEDKSDSDAGSDDEDDEDDDEDEEEEEERMKIQDETETNLVNLRRTIYLTIMSSVDFEEAGHKLLKIKLEPGQEMELCIMLLECCSQERTYLRYYGLLGQRFCMINRIHQENFEKSFVQQYSMIHRLETNKLRNVAKFFAHLLGTNALPWHVLAYIRLTEEDTTSSSRIFIKILFQELSEHLGIRLLNERLSDPTMQDSFESIFPRDNPKNTRFAINFFTSIGLGGITENLREYLKNMPRLIMQQQKPASDSDDESSDSSSSSGSDSSSSESESSSSSEDERERKRKRRK